MMKWSNKPRGSISSSDEGSEDIRRSIEELDKVLDEFDDFSPKHSSKVKKKNGIGSSVKHKSKEKCDGSNVNPKLDPVRQSLDILDTVLAQYEAELIDTKEKDALFESFEDSFEESTEIDRFSKGDDADIVESRGSNDNLASPTSTKQGKKVSPPPVPKRSPTTCLSCSSSFECPSPETLESHREFFSESNSNFEATECLLHSKIDSNYKKKSLYRKRLSSKPVRKGSDRPKVKANDSATSQDDLSDDDDVFTVFRNFADLNKDPKVDEMIEAADKNKARNGESEKHEISAKSFRNSKEKFAFAKYLIKTGALEGLDEEPPSFKPPPIPLPPKTKINKNKKQLQPKDTNGNEVNDEINEVNEFVINKSVQKQTNSESLPHVTSVKINQNSTVNSTQIHSNSNVSVITIQPKISTTNDKNTSVSNAKTATKPALPPKEKNQNPKTLPQQQQSPQLNRNGGQQRVALSTFTRTSTSNNNSKSSSLEDVCSSNNGRTQKAVVIADQLGMTKTGSLPLELKKPSVPTGGAVFFNVFQPDGEKLADDTAVVDDKTKDDKEMEKKRGWKKKKKSKDKLKDSTSNSNESIKGSNSTEQNALLAELTGKIQTKKSATPNGSSSDDSDQGRNQRTEQLDKAPNAKDDKDKGIWKGFWKKKQSPAPET